MPLQRKRWEGRCDMARKPYLIDDEGGETDLPFKWVICSHCEGHGKTSAHLGALSSEDLEDEDFREDYKNGLYDKPCPHCEGGKVAVADTKLMTKAQRKAYREQQDELEAMDRETAMERQAEHYMDCRYAGVNYWEN